MVIFVRQNVCVKAWSVKGAAEGEEGGTHCLIYPNAILLWDTVELESLGLGDSLDEEDAKEMEAGLTTVDSDVVKLSWRHWRCPWGNRKLQVLEMNDCRNLCSRLKARLSFLEAIARNHWKKWIAKKKNVERKEKGSRKETQDTELPKCQAEYSWTGGQSYSCYSKVKGLRTAKGIQDSDTLIIILTE